MKNKQLLYFNFTCLFLFIFLSSCSIKRDLKQKSSYTDTEIKQLRKCNTAKLAWYMMPNSKRIILLTNLVRVNPTLFKKYLHLQTDSAYIDKKYLNRRIDSRIAGKTPTKTKLLKPSLNLALAAKLHSIVSGLNGQVGHQNLTLRMRMTLNTNLYYGENCYYGDDDAYGAVVGWIESEGHYHNLLNSKYYRIGVSGFWHSRYKKNYVQVFSGKKWMDYIWQ